ncbi:bifunctional UDP-sugar hydrolase/5'-nucleotidase [Pedobacter nutrimenti]|uniref:5'-nucleotidase n=1 Tax=Pedobacter nutrimenti TaxID=1241337 RepID=A0A318UED7_9SPHI|nr:hypothetical protein [Pedobacter nutrimenti]PYF74764.1 5'-nucleotidase [Pedobacter nutrimenti]
MSNNRRSFLKNTTLVTAASLLSKPINSLAQISKSAMTLEASGSSVIIYHSNNLNGKINPLKQDIGGISRLGGLLDKQEMGGLILDAGGFLSETADKDHHYDVVTAMNNTGYHASTLSPKELIHGQAHLARLAKAMNFSLLNCNYTFRNTELAAAVKPYQVISFGKFKIGVTGVGPQIPGIDFQDPIQRLNKMADYLKNTLNCHLVICLSALGYQQKEGTTDDRDLSAASAHVDMIIGSNEKHPMGSTMVLKNATGHDVFIGQASPSGLAMGRMTFELKAQQKHTAHTQNLINSRAQSYAQLHGTVTGGIENLV